jgi:hypothetical protein
MPDREITLTEYGAWLTPSDASIYARGALQTTDATTTLWSLVTGGVVRMAGLSCSLKEGDGAPQPLAGPALIPLRRLPHYTSGGSDFWNGTLRFFVPRANQYDVSRSYTYFGVRLDPAALIANLPDLPKPEPLPVTAPIIAPVPSSLSAPIPILATKHAGGAPGKDYWDELWAAMAALVYKGQLNPASKQKDIEEAMVKWAADYRGDDLSIPTARTRARKLLAALRKAEEDNN